MANEEPGRSEGAAGTYRTLNRRRACSQAWSLSFLMVETGRTARGYSRALHVVISLVVPCELLPSRSEALTRFGVQRMSRVLPFTRCVEFCFRKQNNNHVSQRKKPLTQTVCAVSLLWVLLEPMFYMGRGTVSQRGWTKDHSQGRKAAGLTACYP